MGLLALACFADPAGAQTTERAQVLGDRPQELRAELAADGFDVVVEGDGLYVFGGVRDFSLLRRRGLALSKPIAGRPMREILAEKGVERGVPSGYQDLAGINASLLQTALDHPSICQLVDLSLEFGVPRTFEGRSLMALKISDNIMLDEDEPAMLIASAHHSRELVTPVIALEAIRRLTDGYGVVGTITQAVDEHEIWVLPVCNPDGYEYVFNVDNWWRKNRRVVGGEVGVDQNRNYPHGWDSACGGSMDAASSTFRGPAPASEPETQAIVALSEMRRVAKVLDFHSSGQEVVWGYACFSHPFDAYYQAEAAALSTAAGYAGLERPVVADGEHQQWHSGRRGARAMLVETATAFQPDYTVAELEAAQVATCVEWMLAQPLPLSGHVTAACGGAPLEASIRLLGVALSPGEENRSGGQYGRWQANLPPGGYTLEFSAPGFRTTLRSVTISAGSATVLDVQLEGPAQQVYCPSAVNSTGAEGQIALLGSTSVSTNSVTLRASQLPALQTCYFAYGQTEIEQPLLNGFLCVSGPLLRLGVTPANSLGVATLPLDLTQLQSPMGQIVAGSTWNFQAVYRDPAAGGTFGNLTRAIRVPFCP